MPAKADGGLRYRWSGFTVEQMTIVPYRGPRATCSTFPCSQAPHSNINQTSHCYLLAAHVLPFELVLRQLWKLCLHLSLDTSISIICMYFSVLFFFFLLFFFDCAD